MCVLNINVICITIMDVNINSNEHYLYKLCKTFNKCHSFCLWLYINLYNIICNMRKSHLGPPSV